MSLVGPRPLFKEDTAKYDANYMRRLDVLPGITGLLQISDRNAPEFETWYKYDIEYIENWSLGLDLKIILKTPFSLIKIKTRKVFRCGSVGIEPTTLSLKAPALPIELPTLNKNSNQKIKLVIFILLQYL